MRDLGDLAFGLQFGMLESAEDAAPVVVSEKAGMDSYYSEDKASIERTTVPAVKTINSGVQFNLFLGALPSLRPWRDYVGLLPQFRESVKSRRLLAKMAVSAVAKRLASGEPRPDFLTKLISARDESGHPLPEGELSAEAGSFLVAGSDTTSKYVSRLIEPIAQLTRVNAARLVLSPTTSRAHRLSRLGFRKSWTASSDHHAQRTRLSFLRTTKSRIFLSSKTS